VPDGKTLVLEVEEITVSRGGRRIVDDVTLACEAGQFTAILGPNGAGKTTLLRVMSGETPPSAGSVRLGGKHLRHFSSLELARKRSVLSQNRSVGFAYTAREVVSLGRYAYGPHDPDGPERVAQALELVGASHLAGRRYETLSGGEAVKIDVARILAQESVVVLLDEPTNHLDARVQYDVLALFHRLTEHGIVVVAALHDLNHAALFADRVVLMHEGVVVADGLPSIVLEPTLLQRVYGMPCSLVRSAEGRRFIVPAYAG
jgi:iron complex transport system ATP-binding protein